MRQIRSQTKVIATLGPASDSREVLTNMIHEGVDVLRINFSHSNKDEYIRLINLVRELNLELGSNVSILADLQGPKLRVGEIENNSLNLVEGDQLTFVTSKCMGTLDHIYMSYPEFPMDVQVGETILIDDGKIKLEVTQTNRKDTVNATVIYGGVLSSKKGVNLPNTRVSLPCLTDEDIANARFALEHDVDWIALSFVRSAKDVLVLRALINDAHGHAGLISKIEKPEALKDIDGIITLSDGIMVARGDLGVEIPFDQVPLIQKMIVQKCVEQSKPVIIATQMMESMITNFRPTRAEATDVANAVLDNADALMLSGETSVGKYPAETINSMQRIIDFTEENGKPYNKFHEPKIGSPTFLADSLCLNAAMLAQQIKARAIIVFSHSGYTALRISGHRPEADIFAFTNNATLLRKMSLVWGVRAFFFNPHFLIDDAIADSITVLKEKNLVQPGDAVVHVGSSPLAQQGATNMLKVSYVV